MHTAKICVGLVLALGLTASAASASPATAALVAQEDAWAAAMVANDTAAIEKIVAADWKGQNQSGKTVSRAELIAGMKDGSDVVKSMKNHDVHVRIFGDIAIVQGQDDEVSTHKGKANPTTYSWMDVYQKRGGSWLAIASQNTVVTPDK